MGEYAVKKQLNTAKTQTDAAQSLSRCQMQISGMSNQAMLTFLSALPKQRVAEEDMIRQRLTEKFGVDFSGLKVTRDAALADIQERAYTKGNEIHLAPDVNPASVEGQEILTHEAAHVIQQGTRTLPGGMLHDSNLEAQANEIASGAGHIDTSGFSMPVAASGAPVQGFLDFIFNRKRYNERKNVSRAQKLLQQIQENDPRLARQVGKQLEETGLSGGSAIFDPKRDQYVYADAPDRNKFYMGDRGFEHIKGMIENMPRENISPNKDNIFLHEGSSKVYGISQRELNGLLRVDPDTYRTFYNRSSRGAEMMAKKDWAGMSNREFLRSYPLLRAITGMARTSYRSAFHTGMNSILGEDDRNVENKLGRSHHVTNSIMDYADKRLRTIAGMENPDYLQYEVPLMQRAQEEYKNFTRFTPIEIQDLSSKPQTPKKPGFFKRLFGKIGSMFRRK